MNWEIEFSSNLQMMVLTYNGVNNASEIYDSSHSIIDLSKEKNLSSIFVNARKLKLNASKSDLFELPSKLYDKWGRNPSTRTAILEPKDPEAKSKVEFYILATQNLGWSAKMFTSEKDALTWSYEN